VNFKLGERLLKETCISGRPHTTSKETSYEACNYRTITPKAY
jgi:hypothetical protein